LFGRPGLSSRKSLAMRMSYGCVGLSKSNGCMLDSAAALLPATFTPVELQGAAPARQATTWQARSQHLGARLALPHRAGLLLVLLIIVFSLPNLGSSAAFTGVRMGQLQEPQDVFRMHSARAAGKEPEFVETRKVNWSDDDYVTLPVFEETQDNAKKGAAVASFFAGLFFPFVGGFWTGIFFGYMGNSATSGELGRNMRQSGLELGRKYADTADEAGKLLDQAGMSVLKAYNWGAVELQKIRLK